MESKVYKVAIDEDTTITLTNHQQVHLSGVSESQIVSAEMIGDDLIITLSDGRVITLENFGLFDPDNTVEIIDDGGIALLPIISSLAGVGVVAALAGGGGAEIVQAAPAAALNADTGASATDGLTNDGTVNVTLAADAASWEFSTDGGATWTAGTGESFTLAEGTYAEGDVQVRQTDAAGNTSAAAELAAVTVDQSVAAPAAALNADTGLVADNDITVPVATQNTWEFSTDGGATWTAGTGESFTVPAAEYQDGDIQYREVATDPSSVDGVVTEYNFDDPAAPTATYTFPDGFSGEVSTDGGVTWGAVSGPVTGPAFTDDVQVRQTDILNDNFYSDGLTNDGTVNVTLAADAASWEFSTDGGATWTAGTGESFTLAEGTYAEGDVQVRQTDAAGNTSAAAELAAVTVDQSVAAPAAALNADTGASATDGLTNDGTVNVTLAAEAASWEFSTDGGATWVETAVGATNEVTLTLAEGTYAEGDVQVRQTDAAGNTSAAAELAAVTVGNLVESTFAIPGPAEISTLGDVNGDGYQDLIVGDVGAGGSYSFYAGNGDGTFAGGVEVATTMSSSREAQDIVLGDFDGDGNLDMLTSERTPNSAGHSVNLHLGVGDGTFGTGTVIDEKTGFNQSGSAVMEAADLDGDGNLDFVVSEAPGNNLEVFFGNGDGTFNRSVIDSDLDLARDVVIGDVDNDGDLDLLALGGQTISDDDEVALYENNGDGTFSFNSVVFTDFETLGTGGGIDGGDVNGDGNLDLVVSSSSLGGRPEASVLLGDGSGGFSEPTSFVDGLDLSVYDVSFADFNGDGNLDILGTTEEFTPEGLVRAIQLWVGNGDGTFQAGLSIDAEESPRDFSSTVVGDVDNDGILDVAVTRDGSSTFDVYVLDVV